MSRLDEIKAVKQLGEAIGYGNMMDIASALWSKKMTEQTGKPCMMHIPTVEGYLTEEGKEIAHVGLNARLDELKYLGLSRFRTEVDYGKKEKTKRNVATFRKNKWYSCMICNCKGESKLQSITINRHCHEDSVVAFDICDDCLKQLGQDITDYYKK